MVGSHCHSCSDILSGRLPEARIAETLVDRMGAYSAIIYIAGTTIKAVKSDGTFIASGTAGTNDSTVTTAAITTT